MANDQVTAARKISRREALTLMGAISASALAACGPGQTDTPQPSSAPATSSAATATIEARTPVPVPQDATAAASAEAQASSVAVAGSTVVPSCIIRPAQSEGPYFVDEKLNRGDIRSDPDTGVMSAGVPLELVVRVSSISGAACSALAGAQVDVWHCNADGVYSDVQGSAGKKFLRGYQLTDGGGVAQFTTIYPGWYQGRAAHIHFKIRSAGTEFTSQLYFDDAVSEQVYAQAPYADRGQGWLRDAADGIFRNGGDQLLLVLSPNDAGYRATFDIGLQAA